MNRLMNRIIVTTALTLAFTCHSAEAQVKPTPIQPAQPSQPSTTPSTSPGAATPTTPAKSTPKASPAKKSTTAGPVIVPGSPSIKLTPAMLKKLKVKLGPKGKTATLQSSGPSKTTSPAKTKATPAKGPIKPLTKEQMEALKKKQQEQEAKRKEQEAKRKAEAEKAKKEQEKAKKLSKVRMLQFDRRSSVILKTWAGLDTLDQDDKNKRPGMPRPKPQKPEPFDLELKAFQRDVLLGHWPKAKDFLKQQEPEVGKAIYEKLLVELVKPPRRPSMQRLPTQARAFVEQNSMSLEDFEGLVKAAPAKLEKVHYQFLGKVLRLAFDQGHTLENFLKRGQQAVAQGDKGFASKRQCAKFLFAAKEGVHAGQFLPSVEQAIKDNDQEALNLLASYNIAKFQKDSEVKDLENAWAALQAIFVSKTMDNSQKSEALKQAVALAPKIRKELGQTWLEESFTKRPERGMEIISVIGASAARGVEQHPMDAELRLKGLELQSIAISALLKSSPELAEKWSDAIQLLAANWLNEARFAYAHGEGKNLGPDMQRDAWGNVFYMNYGMFNRRASRFKTVDIAKLLEIQPRDTYLNMIDISAKPLFEKICAQLYLKVAEPETAFPYIEKLAKSNPKQAKDLVEEFLKVWTKNHNPNAQRGRRNYFYMYGFRARAEGIPLTRSKQQRNLKELAEWIKRLQALKLGDLKEELLVEAFTNCHSSAEVYRLSAIVKVFGDLEKLKPETLASLIQKMRANLVSVWRRPAEQKRKKTKRKKKDIQAEVMRGYRVATEVVNQALEKHPKSWQLQLAKACVLHDENNYQAEIKNSSQYTERSREAFAAFASAAHKYQAAVPNMRRDEWTDEVYNTWFTACLGAVDLAAVDAHKQPRLKQAKVIKAALQSLPENAREHHMEAFAGGLFARMGGARAEIKFRYLNTGFEICGNHKQAYEAKKVLDYYNDLVSEIKFEAQIDGANQVGHEQSFGIFYNIRHTREIERESGGFGRYLQNQNSNQFYYYNFGRPLENYRDKFEKMAREALEDQFEIQSITFQSDKVQSQAIEGQYGWRVTPYAYVLLKAKGPEVDKVPPLHLDLDFLETSGYVVLPIESQALSIDARASTPPARPFSSLQISQTLDERQAKDGKLIVELRAQANGLIPDWKSFMSFDNADFVINKSEDQGLSVVKFNDEVPENVIVAQRSWLLTLKAKKDLKAAPEIFHFGKAKDESVKHEFQRYNDEDLQTVEATVSLDRQYGQPSRFPPAFWLILGLLSLALVLAFLGPQSASSTHTQRPLLAMPETITPFTVVSLLEQLRSQGQLSEAHSKELTQTLQELEDFYFRGGQGQEPDLEGLAREWLHKTAA